MAILGDAETRCEMPKQRGGYCSSSLYRYCYVAFRECLVLGSTGLRLGRGAWLGRLTLGDDHRILGGLVGLGIF